VALNRLLSSVTANERGIFAFICCCAAFSGNDTLIKIVVGSYPVGEVMFARGLFAAVCFTGALFAFRQVPTVHKVFQPLVLARVLLDAGTAAMGAIALLRLGVAELATIVLASPLLITIMAVLIYKEPVGWRRWSAIFIGFIGVLFIVRPDADAINSWALFAIAAAVFASARDLITRQIHRTVPILGISLLSSILLGAIGIAIGLTETWIMFSPRALLYVFLAAIFHSIGTYLGVVAFRGVTVSVVSPFRYTMLLWSGLGGYLVFSEVPNRSFLIGAALIVCGGLYSLHREAVTRRYLSANPTNES
jgi:drug/metabolite transporter (DMT)-like permease